MEASLPRWQFQLRSEAMTSTEWYSKSENFGDIPNISHVDCSKVEIRPPQQALYPSCCCNWCFYTSLPYLFLAAQISWGGLADEGFLHYKAAMFREGTNIDTVHSLWQLCQTFTLKCWQNSYFKWEQEFGHIYRLLLIAVYMKVTNGTGAKCTTRALSQ